MNSATCQYYQLYSMTTDLRRRVLVFSQICWPRFPHRPLGPGTQSRLGMASWPGGKTAWSEHAKMRLIYVIRPPPGGDWSNGRSAVEFPAARPVPRGGFCGMLRKIKNRNRLRCNHFKWLGRQDSNLRMRDPKSRALPTWRLPKTLVELSGIEPLTSYLQSRRSPS